MESWTYAVVDGVSSTALFCGGGRPRGVSEAARRVHVSQPALSRQIKLLEEELGAPLFERVRQRIHLTGAGEVFLPRARRILLDAEEAKARVRAEFGKARPVVRIGFITPFLDDLVAPAVRAFQSTHEGIDVEFHDLPPRLLLERLAAGGLDLVLLGNFEKIDGEPFHVETLWSHRMEAVLPEGHGLARRRTLRLIELKNEKWISLADSHFPGRNAFFSKPLPEGGLRAPAGEGCRINFAAFGRGGNRPRGGAVTRPLVQAATRGMPVRAHFSSGPHEPFGVA